MAKAKSKTKKTQATRFEAARRKGKSFEESMEYASKRTIDKEKSGYTKKVKPKSSKKKKSGDDIITKTKRRLKEVFHGKKMPPTPAAKRLAEKQKRKQRRGY